MRTGILAGGSWIADNINMIDVWPAQETLATISRRYSSNGGAAYNLLVDLTQLGAQFPLEGIGMIGDDENGRAILADCARRGINTRQLRVTASEATSFTEVMTVEHSGRRTFFHQRGANATLKPDHFDLSSSCAKIFPLGYLLLLDHLDLVIDAQPEACRVLQRAQDAGMLTSLDCVSENSGRFETIVRPALRYVDLLFVNDFEAEKLTRIALRREDHLDPNAVIAAADSMLASGVRSWVVVHFPEATYACSTNGQKIWQPSVRVPHNCIQGSAGAGDALAAGVLYGVHNGWPMEQSLRLGTCAAAASLFHPTCSGGIQTTASCLDLGERLGFGATPLELS